MPSNIQMIFPLFVNIKISSVSFRFIFDSVMSITSLVISKLTKEVRKLVEESGWRIEVESISVDNFIDWNSLKSGQKLVKVFPSLCYDCEWRILQRKLWKGISHFFLFAVCMVVVILNVCCRYFLAAVVETFFIGVTERQTMFSSSSYVSRIVRNKHFVRASLFLDGDRYIASFWHTFKFNQLQVIEGYNLIYKFCFVRICGPLYLHFLKLRTLLHFHSQLTLSPSQYMILGAIFITDVRMGSVGSCDIKFVHM